MWVTITISIIAIFLAYLSQYKSGKKCLEFGFVLLTIIASIQYGYGTDYMRYYELWLLQYSSLDIKDFIYNFFNQTGWQEPGWILLNAIFGFENGFFVLVALISIVENYIYYRLIKDYVSTRWRWFAVFLYVGMDCLYLLNFSMFRQGLCVALFVAAVMLMNKNKLFYSLVIMIFSLTIHLSSAVCLPFIILYFLPLKNTRTLSVVLLILTIVIFVFKDVIASLLDTVLTVEKLGKYSTYSKKYLEGIGIGYIFRIVPNIIILYALFTDKVLESKAEKVVSLLAFCDIIITPLQMYGAELAGRLAFFFIAFKVAAIPMMYRTIKNSTTRLILLFITIFITIVMYVQFFQVYIEGYSEGYKTIFSVIL